MSRVATAPPGTATSRKEKAANTVPGTPGGRRGNRRAAEAKTYLNTVSRHELAAARGLIRADRARDLRSPTSFEQADARNPTGIAVRYLTTAARSQRVNIEEVRAALRRTGPEAPRRHDRVAYLEHLIHGCSTHRDNLIRQISFTDQANQGQLNLALEDTRDTIAQLRAARIDEIKGWIQDDIRPGGALRRLVDRIQDFSAVPEWSDDPEVADVLAMVLVTYRTGIKSYGSLDSDRAAVYEQMKATGRPLFQNNDDLFNFDPVNRVKDKDDPTRVSRLDAYMANRAAMQVFQLTHRELFSDDAAVKFEAREALKTFLRLNREDVLPVIELEADLVIGTAMHKYDAELETDSGRVKVQNSAQNKLAGRYENKRLNDMTDISAYRVIASDLNSLEKLMLTVEEHFGDAILEKESMFHNEAKMANSYEAVHYIIRLDDTHCFELQLKTDAALKSNWEHPLYKDDVEQAVMRLVRAIQKRCLAVDHLDYLETEPDPRTLRPQTWLAWTHPEIRAAA